MKRRSGFTLVEVMVSLGVMVIGSMAIIGMQQQTTRANVRAREIGTAMQIAQTWIERLKLDGLRWRSVGNSTTDLQATQFLGVNNGNGTAGLFTTIVFPTNDPGLIASGISNGFDYFGNDMPTTTMTGVAYCASYRVTWVYRDTTTNPPSQDRALRVDVRVWWPKETGTAPTNSVSALAIDFPGCVDNGLDLSPPGLGGGASGTQYENYHIVYLSTVLRPML